MREQARRFMNVLETTVHHRLVTGARSRTPSWSKRKSLGYGSLGPSGALEAAFGDKAFKPPEIKSPAQIEKLSSRGKELALEYGYKPESAGLSVAPLSDPGPRRNPSRMHRSSKAMRNRSKRRVSDVSELDSLVRHPAIQGVPLILTPARKGRFDKVFDSMDQTFKAMDELFDVARSAGATPPPRSGTVNEGAKGSNHDGRDNPLHPHQAGALALFFDHAKVGASQRPKRCAEIFRDLRARKGRFRCNRWDHGQRDQVRAWFILGQPRRLLPCGNERRHRRQASNREGRIGRTGQIARRSVQAREKAEKRAALYAPFAGILTASSQFDIELARLEAGKIIDIPAEEHARAQAGKDLFYPGAYVVPAVAFKAFRRKTLDAKDGVTAYLQNCLFIRKGEKLAGAGGPNNNEVFGSYAGYSDVDPTALAPTAAKRPARKAARLVTTCGIGFPAVG
jgi:hypothetical protein